MFFTLAVVWFVLSLVGVVASYSVGGFIGGFITNIQTLIVFAVLLAAFGA
jgi:hypothetical protein